ncbi:hypothetical protein LCGC14_0541130 [marine sediment metagenome]|uniref:Uncharacterized protein n=1 Tax=marine sediment metagenome TaxID=412755 RepID=A0A0F9RXD8_9ZZZZ
MDRQTIALVCQEAGKFITELIRTRPPKRHEIAQPVAIVVKEEEVEEQPPEVDKPPTITEKAKASGIEAGCVPCAIGHLGTCSGLTNEAVRFAKKDGVQSGEVIDRVNMCIDELNTMERVDLRPEMIVNLTSWEKDLANQALVASRSARHELEGLNSVEGLERAAANIQSTRKEIGRGWFKERLARMPKEEKQKLAEKAIEKLEEVT